VEYQQGGISGIWELCTANDGAFDETEEEFICNFGSPSDDEYTLYFRTLDYLGNETPDGSEPTITFTVDLTNPTLTNTTSQTLSYDTESSTLHFTTNENATCRYATNENTPWNDMTLFQTTGETSHQTPIESLSQGNEYTYSIRCQDEKENESQETFTITIAPKEEDRKVSDSSFQTENETSSTKQRKDKTLYFTKEGITLTGEDSSIANGRIKVYLNNRRIQTIDIDENGNYESEFDIKHGNEGTLKLKYYDQYGTKVKQEEQEIHVDTKKPQWINTLPEELTIERNQRIDFPIQEKDTGIDFYKVRLEPIRGWRKQDESYYYIPETVPNGTYKLYVRTCDKADNCTQENIKLTVIEEESQEGKENTDQSTQQQDSQTPVSQESVQGVETQREETKDTTPKTESEAPNEKFPSFTPEGRQETQETPSQDSCQSIWWNPFTWEC
jgi:hypothetical protein